MNRAAQMIAQTLLLLLTEGGARLAEWIHPGGEDIVFDYAPYRMQRMVRAPWPLNREGFRAGALESYKGSFLVEFLGGSVCLGEGMNPGRPVPERLEEMLHAAGLAQARVLNLCQGGASSAQELAIFTQFGLPLEPQVVVSFDGANDLMHPRPIGDDEEANLPYRDAQMRAQFYGHHSWVAHLALARVASRLARYAPVTRVGRVTRAGGGVAREEILGSYLYTLGLTRTLAESRGALYTVMLQPTLHFAKPWSPEETIMWTRLRPGNGEEISRRAAALYSAAIPALGLWARGGDTQVLDLTRVFENTPEMIYSDSVHFSGERGYAMLSAEIQKQGLFREITRRYQEWERRTGKVGQMMPREVSWAPQP